ncbi:MAG TPA: Nif3-like dinuclear metal center hexameric protein, partial [Thermoanaerobacterales bacterium]|nr:Nif3-like dinuclear metal center hexameric protein [Thermoanaerobacterales bacterium]
NCFVNDHIMILSHHPLIFNKLKSVRSDFYVGGIIHKLIKNDINVYCAHTNLDIAFGGVNDVLAKNLNLVQVKPLEILKYDNLKKIVVFVPKDHVDSVVNAMANAGAGWIGNYSHCSFKTPGKGTFKPLEGSNPYIGKAGQIEEVEEYRIEMIVLNSKFRKVVNEMLKSHPYEEVAYDIYNLDNLGEPVGLGRIGKLSEPTILKNLVSNVKNLLKVDYVRIVGDINKKINKIAVCGGSGASLIHKSVAKGADVLVTSDVKYHQAQEAFNLGLQIVDVGHWDSEKLVLPTIIDEIKTSLTKANLKTQIINSKINERFLEFV